MEGRAGTDERSALRRWAGTGLTIALAALMALVLRTFVVESFWIPSGSMESTLAINDRVMVEKISTLDGPARGDVVVFDGDGSFDEAGVHRDYIKRVIATGGDTVECCSSGRVVVNGEALEEPYLFEDDAAPFAPVTVPEGEVWVMGDHRSDSADSRYHGTVPVSALEGRAVLVFWPFSHLTTL